MVSYLTTTKSYFIYLMGENMNNKFKKHAIAAAMGATFAIASASAFANVTWFPPVTSFEDDNMEWHLDNDNDGVVSVGDTLVSILEINQSFGEFGGGPAGFGGEEMTGVLAIDVTGAVNNGAGLGWSFTFGEAAGGLDSYLGANATGHGAAGSGALVAMWLDDTPDLTVTPPNCGSLAACTALASDGDLWEVDGLGASVIGDELGVNGDAFFVANVISNDPDDIAALTSGQDGGSVNFGLSIQFNGTGQTLTELSNITPVIGAGGAPISIDMAGSGGINGGLGLGNGAFSRSDFQFTKASIEVPEPGTVALFGLGLLGLVGMRKKRV